MRMWKNSFRQYASVKMYTNIKIFFKRYTVPVLKHYSKKPSLSFRFVFFLSILSLVPCLHCTHTYFRIFSVCNLNNYIVNGCTLTLPIVWKLKADTLRHINYKHFKPATSQPLHKKGMLKFKYITIMCKTKSMTYVNVNLVLFTITNNFRVYHCVVTIFLVVTFVNEIPYITISANVWCNAQLKLPSFCCCFISFRYFRYKCNKHCQCQTAVNNTATKWDTETEREIKTIWNE